MIALYEAETDECGPSRLVSTIDGSAIAMDLAIECVRRGVFSPDGQLLYAPAWGNPQVAGLFDTNTGELKARIPTNSGPHGLTYFPSRPYPHSIGHNGVYWMD